MKRKRLKSSYFPEKLLTDSELRNAGVVNLQSTSKLSKNTVDYIAQKSGVSVGTIRSFEQTGTISLDNLIKILRTLSLAGNFEFLIPNLGVNSVDLHRLGHSKQRARSKKKNNEIPWGDEK